MDRSFESLESDPNYHGARNQADVHGVGFWVEFNFHGVTPYFSNLLVDMTVTTVTTTPFSQITRNNMRF